MSKITKDTRVSVRLSQRKKDKFFRVCHENGLIPSILITRWIDVFVKKSNKYKVDFSKIQSAATERVIDRLNR